MDFVRSLIRSIFLLAVALALLSFIPSAAAQNSQCWGNGLNGACTGDQGEAKMAAYRVLERQRASFASSDAPDRVRLICWFPDSPGSVGGYVTHGQNPPGACNSSYAVQVTRTYPSAQSCSARNSSQLADAQPWYTEPSNCIAGCQVYGERYTTTTGGVTIYGMRDRSYTGQTCIPQQPSQDIQQVQDEKSDATQEKSPECTALGQGQTACVKPNGQYCATASTGATFCWEGQETGAKTQGQEAQVKDQADKPVTPPTTPPDSANLEWQRTQGHQKTACINNTCITYNVTNFTSVPTGQAKNSTAPNDPTGSTNTSGNGKPNGSGDGKDGEGDKGTPGSADCQRVPTCSNGDSIGCAMLRQHHAMSCRISDEGGYTSDTEAGQGQAAPSTAIVYGDGELSSLLNNINLDGWAAPGRCPVVLQFNALGRSYTMDNEHFCQILQALAALINIVAAIHAGFIITGGRR